MRLRVLVSLEKIDLLKVKKCDICVTWIGKIFKSLIFSGLQRMNLTAF